MSAIIRDYHPSDLERVKALHDESSIDYRFPNLSSPLFLVTKILEVEGVVRACGGCYLTSELYLWLDKSDWGDPEQKLAAIEALDKEAMHELWLKGIDEAVLWLPPGMERFGERLETLGFKKDREWATYSKKTQ